MPRLDPESRLTPASRKSPEAEHLHRLRIAYDRRRTAHHVASRYSAALLHGLPLYRIPRLPHFSSDNFPSSTRSSFGINHKTTFEPEDIVEVSGFRCTSLARTLFDLARFASVEDALVALDFALHREISIQSVESLPAWDSTGKQSLPDAAPILTSQLLKRVANLRAENPRARGVKRARFVSEFASPAAESALESISRLRFHQLELPEPDLQFPVLGPQGQVFRLDFRFAALGFFGECDGRAKYGHTPEEVAEALYREKLREDWIRAQTGLKCVRWGWSAVASPEALAAVLRNAHIPLRHRPGL